ncbi:MAG: hypothetical protein A3E83_01745 [Gammaproteobacteria bacterium RIFCSPHIGHO2_12_FULL_41_20]|nr:MAG: hypothetical protein A3E83_01745 [Gammaproteobacteria bacterium RIFCSPHIGHO2_12_FULL_41_20]
MTMNHILFSAVSFNELMETPIDSIDHDDLSLSEERLITLVTQLSEYIHSHSIDDIKRGSAIYWLTYALHYSVSRMQTEVVEQIISIAYALAKKDPDAFCDLLSQPFQGGDFHGQSAFFVWMDELYSSVLDEKSHPNIVSLNFIFSYLLDHVASAVALALAKNHVEGSAAGKSGLLLIILTLLQAASIPYNQAVTQLMAELLLKCMTKAPNIINRALTQEIMQGPFGGKSIIYFLVSVLRELVRDKYNESAVNIVSNILLNVMQKGDRDSLARSLFGIVGEGPYAGCHPLHIVLMSLVSAAYVNNNDIVFKQVIMVLQQLYNIFSNEMLLALTKEITHGKHMGKNGAMMLIRAFIAGLDHKLDVTPLADGLSKLIDANPEALVYAFMCPIGSMKEGGTSYLSLLIRILNEQKQSDSKFQSVMVVMTRLTASTQYRDRILQLSADERRSLSMHGLYAASPSIKRNF